MQDFGEDNRSLHFLIHPAVSWAMWVGGFTVGRVKDWIEARVNMSLGMPLTLIGLGVWTERFRGASMGKRLIRAMVGGVLVGLLSGLLGGLLGLGTAPAIAGPLSDRMAQYPDWNSPPPTRAARGDLAYPDWFEGDWQATCTLIDLVAPLAPEINSPGFEGNQTLLDQPVDFAVRFVPRRSRQRRWTPALPAPMEVVSDRGFNGLNIAKAYLGEDLVVRVEEDPKDPNTQVTTLRGNRTLVSRIPSRAVETPSNEDFITSEIFQQVFRGSGSPYLNQVETTTAYHFQPESEPTILADQVTAVYLSPQDENYFKAGNQPIALYRYRLELRSPSLANEPEANELEINTLDY